MGDDPDIPKCDLPAKKKPARSAKAKVPAKGKAPPPAKGKAKPPAKAKRKPAAKPAAPEPVWDAKAEAAAAKAAALKKMGRGKLIDAPEGAIVIPGVSKRPRSKPETRVDMEPGPMGGRLKRTRKVEPEPAPEETKKERAARLRKEIEAGEALAEKRKVAVIAEARAAHERKINEEVFFEMLLLLAQGMTLRRICRMPGMPSRTLFHMHVNCEDDDLAKVRSERLARARAMGMDEIADEVMDIVDDSSNDYMEGEDGPELDREAIARSKLRAETRLKLLAVWEPTRYGARLNHADADGKPLRGEGMTAGDLAIGLAKLVEAARRNDLSLGSGVIIDQEPSA